MGWTARSVLAGGGHEAHDHGATDREQFAVPEALTWGQIDALMRRLSMTSSRRPGGTERWVLVSGRRRRIHRRRGSWLPALRCARAGTMTGWMRGAGFFLAVWRSLRGPRRAWGERFARVLREAGADVVVTARRAERLKQLASQLDAVAVA